MGQLLPTVQLRPGRRPRPGTFAYAPGGQGRGPLVSCLMVTRGSAFPARFAIECYRRQSYPNRELVIVCDRPASALSRLVSEIADPTIRYVEAAPANLGELRNISVAQARGALMCQWDDDDLFHRDRIDLQAMVLTEHEDVAAVFFQRWLIWWPHRKIFAVSGRRTWEGTIMARREALSAYPAQALGEDNLAVARLCAVHNVELIDWHHGYCYVVHGANSYGNAHFEQMIGWATQRWSADQYASKLAALSECLPIADYADALELQTPE